MTCEQLAAMSLDRQIAAARTATGLALARALGMTPAQLLRVIRQGALAGLCAAARAEGALAAFLQANTEGEGSSMAYENCRVFYDAAGNMRVQCPQPAPGGACGCEARCVRPNTNCIPADPAFAPCTVESVCKGYKLAPFTASIVVGPATGNAEPVSLFERVSTTRFILTVLPVGAASKLCMTSIAVRITNGLGVETVRVPQSAGFTTARLYQDPQGSWVWGWETPTVVYAPNFTITDYRCTCPPGELCGCQLYNGPTRVQFDLLASQLTAGEVLSVTVGYSRENCGMVQCAPCEPGQLCNNTLLRSTYTQYDGSAVSPNSYLWGGGLPPQEPVLSYGGNFNGP